MGDTEKKKYDIKAYIDDSEYVANIYVMRCFTVTMLVYVIGFVLNLLNIFIVDKEIMVLGFLPSIIVYLIVLTITKKISLSNWKVKYFILFNIILVFTLIGVTITYHVVVVALLPILYATLYSSKRVMYYVYFLTVISTIIVVYGGYYSGLCDANMALLTSTSLSNYLADGGFSTVSINSNPNVTLMLYFVVPRCFVYIAFTAISTSIIRIIKGSVEKARYTAQMEEFQKELKKKVDEQTIELRAQQEKLEEAYMQTVVALSEAVEAKDRYTSGHSKRVAKYSKMIAAKLGKNEEEQENIYRAGLLHDVGKIRIPEEIINKPGKLTDDEYNMIKIHPVTGFHILRGISEHNDMSLASKYHHERYDGKGYPNGLAGESIPEEARILGVADSYDAMTSNRSYRKALPQEMVKAEIEKGKGAQFDPKIADIMIQMIDEDKEYTMRQVDQMEYKVLIVDEDEANNQYIRDIMKEQYMYEFTSVCTVRRAYEMLEEQEFDLIMLDACIGHVNDYELFKNIRQKCKTPIVIMADETCKEGFSDFVKLGCDDYFTKPFSPLMVKEVIYNMTKKIH